jgi:hypothetical protein
MPLNSRTETPTNEDRAEWARAAVEAYARQTRCDVREHVVDDADGLDEILGDLLCDARHLAAAYSVDFNDLIERSLGAWREECDEEADED